jgi:hypothetical protein
MQEAPSGESLAKADRDDPVDEPVGAITRVSTDDPRVAATAPAEEDLDQRLSDAFDAQLDRERQELEAEDEVTTSHEVTTSNEPTTAGAAHGPEKSWETDAHVDGLTWESEPESERDGGLEM